MSNEKLIYIEDEIKASYLDYSMSVIVSRALPDVRDGLKPVHRRILFAMNDMGMSYDKAYKKSARIVGEVLGKYHPHGDSAVYNAMVRMAQEFNLRYMLIQGHGNFGSIDGDSAAAMRYTEARMSKIAGELLLDIDKNTIDYRKNFDESLEEPEVLPAKLPNLLLNGSTGIAVGMATNIPPHNMGELADAIITLIDNKDASIDDLMEHLKGPDFPTGGIIYGKKGIYEAYHTGRGRVRIAGKLRIEENKKGKESIIIDELPYQVNKARLIEKIANLIKDKKIQGITDLRDESDRDGIRIVIELKKGEESELIINKLYKYTELQVTFGVIMLALVNNIPRVLNLKQILEHYLKHRYNVIKRKLNYQLDKAEKKAHILEGFKIALGNIDEMIELIKKSNDSEGARNNLISLYKLSDSQARAILDMKLQKITGLEREKIDNDYNDTISFINNIKEILASDEKIYKIIRDEIIELKNNYGDKRRTQLEVDRLEINPEDLIKDEEVIVTITNKGYIKRINANKYTAQNRGGKGIAAHSMSEEDFVEDMYLASNLDNLMIFTNTGRVYNLKVYEIPESSRQARGKLIGNLINLRPEEKFETVIKVRDFSEEKEVVFITRMGTIKKTNLSLFKNINKSGLIAINLRDGDDLIYSGISNYEDEIFIATQKGYSIRIKENNVRSMGRTAAGVKAINLRKNDSVISAMVIRDVEEKTVLTVTEKGYGKRTALKNNYTLQSRGGKGVINIKVNDKTGDVVEVKSVIEEDELILITSNGTLIRTRVKDISVTGRATSGVKVMRVKKGEKVVSLVKIKKEELQDLEDNYENNSEEEEN